MLICYKRIQLLMRVFILQEEQFIQKIGLVNRQNGSLPRPDNAIISDYLKRLIFAFPFVLEQQNLPNLSFRYYNYMSISLSTLFTQNGGV